MYFVYENWTHKRGRAHLASCSYCNQGRGTQASHSGKNDQWHECANKEDAEFQLAKLRNKGWNDVKWCANCS